jgi:hypothetical protein
LILSLFNLNVPLVTGVGTGALVFSILVVIVAALYLLLDFSVIAHGIATGGAEDVLLVLRVRTHGHHHLALHRDPATDRHRSRSAGVGCAGDQTGANRGPTPTSAW